MSRESGRGARGEGRYIAARESGIKHASTLLKGGDAMEYLAASLLILAIVGMKRAIAGKQKALDIADKAKQARLMSPRFKVAYTIASRDGQGEPQEETGLLESEARQVAQSLLAYQVRVTNIRIERE